MQRPWGDEHSPWVHHQGLPRVDTAQLEGPAEDREVLRKKGGVEPPWKSGQPGICKVRRP